MFAELVNAWKEENKTHFVFLNEVKILVIHLQSVFKALAFLF